MKLLHIDSSIQGAGSTSRPVSAAVVESLRSADSSIEVTYRDLVASPIPHLTLEAFAGAEAGQILEEFLASDIVVIGAGFYNFTIPSQLKAWIDRVVIAGKTFSYGEFGPVGLAAGKRVIVALARGAVYSGESPMASAEHAETLLRLTFGFIGITDIEVIVAEGTRLGDESHKAALEGALAKAKEVALEPIAA